MKRDKCLYSHVMRLVCNSLRIIYHCFMWIFFFLQKSWCFAIFFKSFGSWPLFQGKFSFSEAASNYRDCLRFSFLCFPQPPFYYFKYFYLITLSGLRCLPPSLKSWNPEFYSLFFMEERKNWKSKTVICLPHAMPLNTCTCTWTQTLH